MPIDVTWVYLVITGGSASPNKILTATSNSPANSYISLYIARGTREHAKGLT